MEVVIWLNACNGIVKNYINEICKFRKFNLGYYDGLPALYSIQGTIAFPHIICLLRVGQRVMSFPKITGKIQKLFGLHQRLF